LQPAPAWTCANLDGQNIRSTNFAGKVIILDFWATWCGPCKAEIPDFIALQNKYGNDGLMIIGLSVDSGGSQLVRDFVRTNGINYTMLMANSAVQSGFGGISAIPTTFIIDRNNLLRAKYVGTRSRTVFENAIRPLLYNNICVQTRCSPGQLALAWPTNAAQFVLESTPTLAPPAWSYDAAIPQIINGMNTFQLPVLQSNRFYRLRLAN
jgi:thiol-disulfide isomerase/thioredoxin